MPGGGEGRKQVARREISAAKQKSKERVDSQGQHELVSGTKLAEKTRTRHLGGRKPTVRFKIHQEKSVEPTKSDSTTKKFGN